MTHRAVARIQGSQLLGAARHQNLPTARQRPHDGGASQSGANRAAATHQATTKHSPRFVASSSQRELGDLSL
jgi:hypothetical protein